jgi:hypothetical protein
LHTIPTGNIKSIEKFEHVAELQETLPEDHQDRLGFQHELATTYLDNRRITEHVVKVRKKVLANHTHRLASQHELVRAYWSNHQTQEALELLERVIAIKQEELCADDSGQAVSE